MKKLLIFFLFPFLVSCGFHLQGPLQLVPPLRTIFIQTPDPYGSLSRSLREYMRMSDVTVACSPAQATAILVIMQDITSQELLSVSSTQQTRQYVLKVNVAFEINDPRGRTIVPPQSVIESRMITVQSNQILGSSNEANLYYQQMRRSIAYAIMNRLNSQQIGRMVMAAYKEHG